MYVLYKYGVTLKVRWGTFDTEHQPILNRSLPSLLNNCVIRGRGCPALEAETELRGRKSIQNLHFPPGFGTKST